MLHTDLMNLPKLQDADVSGKRVLVRVDLDVPVENGEVKEKYRLESWKPTIDLLLEKGASMIVLIGHMGRPLDSAQDKSDGKVDEALSTKILVPTLSEILGQEIVFEGDGKIVLKENLRFDPGEEGNSEEYTKKLSELGDFYVNDSFATAHREHASIVGIPKYLPHAAGIRLEKEIENLGKVLDNPKKPVVTLLSGIKEDKVKMIKGLEEISDLVLIGGRLPEYLGDEALISVRQKDNRKVIVGNLNQDKEDITLNTSERFAEEVKSAGTIVLAGVLGRYEDKGHRQGTEKVFRAISESSAFKVAGGGDTINALNMFSIFDKFDWVSVGGGAMVEFLTKKTLPCLEALQNGQEK